MNNCGIPSGWIKNNGFAMGITPIFLIFGEADTEIIHSSSFIIHSSLFRFARPKGAINRNLGVHIIGEWFMGKGI